MIGGLSVVRTSRLRRLERDPDATEHTARRTRTLKSIVDAGAVGGGVRRYTGRANSRRIAENATGRVLCVEGILDGDEEFRFVSEAERRAQPQYVISGERGVLVRLVATIVLIAHERECAPEAKESVICSCTGTRAHRVTKLAGTLMSEAGVPPKRAQEILGHADVRTTLAIYTHSMRRKVRRLGRQDGRARGAHSAWKHCGNNWLCSV